MKKIILCAVIISYVVALSVYFNANKMPAEWSEYVVCSGDTVCDISIDITPNADEYRKTEHFIIKKNNLENATIYPGQTILVPDYE